MPDLANGNHIGSNTLKPKVSVIIPLYNHETFIEEAVNSVLGQTFEAFELIVIDDGSTDSSADVVNVIPDGRIRYFFQENQGAPAAINRGVQLSRGEFISILNSDDVYYPRRLEECVRILESDPSLSAVFNHLEFIDGSGKFIKYLRGAEENWTDHTTENSFKGMKNVVLDLLAGNFLTTTSNLFCRRAAFETVGSFANLRYAHDYDFFLRLCYHHKVHIIEKPLVKYRIHSQNTVKENEAGVDFEVGMVLANFLLNNDVYRYFRDNESRYDIMIKFMNSVNTHNTDMLLAALFLFVMKYPEIKSDVRAYSLKDEDNRFRNACIARFRKNIDAWRLWKETNDRLVERDKELKEGWSQWHEINERLSEKDKELREGWSNWKETNNRLAAIDKELQKAYQGLASTNEQLALANKQLDSASQQLASANQQLTDKDSYILALNNSPSYRLGRVLTWPLRKIFGRNL